MNHKFLDLFSNFKIFLDQMKFLFAKLFLVKFYSYVTFNLHSTFSSESTPHIH